MGVYANITTSGHTRHADGTETWTETRTTPGLTHTREVTASKWHEERDNCFCCSCPEHAYADPFCRNHGFAGSRPCEEHSMPGTPDEFGNMPRSVQSARRNELAEADTILTKEVD